MRPVWFANGVVGLNYATLKEAEGQAFQACNQCWQENPMYKGLRAPPAPRNAPAIKNLSVKSRVEKAREMMRASLLGQLHQLAFKGNKQAARLYDLAKKVKTKQEMDLIWIEVQKYGGHRPGIDVDKSGRLNTGEAFADVKQARGL